ncbi:MAG: hypothetical protein L0G27_12250, partial [Paracoccus sp. (in: a-proteobacteria)]|nr:hypothetical protein [Paracoccus sp. (in: a-proteobacteria)]
MIWIVMIVIGAVVVSLWAAQRLGQPLELLGAAMGQLAPLQVHADALTPKRALLSICDDGPGIPKNLRHRSLSYSSRQILRGATPFRAPGWDWPS